MEPKLIRKDIKYQKKTLIVVSLLVISLFVGGSFALLSSSDETEEVVTFKTGNFNLEAKTTGTLSLDGEVPKSYDDGFKNNDITLTLTNTGSLEIGKYDVKLEGDTGTTLDASYIRYSVSDDEGKTYLASKLLSETNNIIYTGYSLKTTKVLKVKLWIDEAAGENALKKSYNGKINVELYQNDDTLVDVVKSKLVSNYSGSSENFEGGLVAVNTNGDLYHETNSEEIREYRYSGPTVNNYVTFNDEVWRIVGVFKDETGEEYLKIMKNDVILASNIPTNYKINNVDYKLKQSANDTICFYNYITGTETDKNDWVNSGLKNYLNTEKDESEIPNYGYLHYLSSDAKSMLRMTKYYLGNAYSGWVETGDYGVKEDTKQTYLHERDIASCVNNTATVSNQAGCYIWSGNQATWEGLVSLIYPSDYGYSVNSSYWNLVLGKWDNNGYYKEEVNSSSWIINNKKDNTILLLSPTIEPGKPIYIMTINPFNFLGAVSANSQHAFYPLVTLKNDVKIISGDGTSTNPYKLILE